MVAPSVTYFNNRKPKRWTKYSAKRPILLASQIPLCRTRASQAVTQPARPNFLFGYFDFGQAKKKYLAVTGETVIQPNPRFVQSHSTNPRAATIPHTHPTKTMAPLNSVNSPPQHMELTNTATVTAPPQPPNARRSQRTKHRNLLD